MESFLHCRLGVEALPFEDHDLQCHCACESHLVYVHSCCCIEEYFLMLACLARNEGRERDICWHHYRGEIGSDDCLRDLNHMRGTGSLHFAFDDDQVNVLDVETCLIVDQMNFDDVEICLIFVHICLSNGSLNDSAEDLHDHDCY